ncbi:MAG: hypothetical protein ABSG13_01185 [Bryobacteraceae bacterium]|jgi:hypothetical protein
MNIKITITPLSATLISVVVIVWILAGTHPAHSTLWLLAKATPFLLLMATWIAGLAMLRR